MPLCPLYPSPHLRIKTGITHKHAIISRSVFVFPVSTGTKLGVGAVMVIVCDHRNKFFNDRFISQFGATPLIIMLVTISVSIGVARRVPISNVEVNCNGSAGLAGFTQWIVVKTVIKWIVAKNFVSSHNPISFQNQNYRFLKGNRLKKTFWMVAHSHYMSQKFLQFQQRLTCPAFTTGVLKLNNIVCVKFSKCLRTY